MCIDVVCESKNPFFIMGIFRENARLSAVCFCEPVGKKLRPGTSSSFNSLVNAVVQI